jgi:hypothetical protein
MVSRIKNAFRIYKSFRDVCASRIKTAFRIWKNYRAECVAIIQRTWRSYTSVAPAYDLKMYNEPMIQGKKERHRFSLIRFPQTHEYPNLAQYPKIFRRLSGHQKSKRVIDCNGIRRFANSQNRSNNLLASETVLFSAKGKVVVHPGIFSSR